MRSLKRLQPRVLHGDCLEVMREFRANSFDSCVTDPPYGLAFMGSDWDRAVPGVDYWREVFRALKPGAHLLAFGGTRTYHRMACAIEDAGFEIRDCIQWLYGSGFPKSLDVSKAIDKRPGVNRHAEFAADLRAAMAANGYTNTFDVAEKVIGRRTGAVANWQKYQWPEARWWPGLRDLLGMDEAKWGFVIAEAERERIGVQKNAMSGWNMDGATHFVDRDITAPATDAARQWDGWGTALKPAFEPVLWAQKDLRNTKEYCNVISWLDQTIVALCARMATPLSGIETNIVLNIASLWSGCLAAASSDASTSTTETASATIIALETLRSLISVIIPDSIIQGACLRHGSSLDVLIAKNALSGLKTRNKRIRRRSARASVSAPTGNKDESTSVRNAIKCSTNQTCKENVGPSSVLLRALGKRPDKSHASASMSDALNVIDALKSSLVALSGLDTAVEPAWRVPTVKVDRSTAAEMIVLARKPLSEPTVAANVLRWGTGAINVGACRVATNGEQPKGSGDRRGGDIYAQDQWTRTKMANGGNVTPPAGRWPANVIHDGSDEVVAAFPDARSSGHVNRSDSTDPKSVAYGARSFSSAIPGENTYADSGSAARFFYCAKASKRERAGSTHPTVKPLSLMRYLVRLVTPPGGKVLDPFAGSGTTAQAAIAEGMVPTVIERERTYVADIKRRLRQTAAA